MTGITIEKWKAEMEKEKNTSDNIRKENIAVRRALDEAIKRLQVSQEDILIDQP